MTDAERTLAALPLTAWRAVLEANLARLEANRTRSNPGRQGFYMQEAMAAAAARWNQLTPQQRAWWREGVVVDALGFAPMLSPLGERVLAYGEVFGGK